MVRLRVRKSIGHGSFLALLVFSLIAPGGAAACDHPWFPFLSNNVAAGQHSLWCDTPAGSPAGEAGLLWFINNQAFDETVGYMTKDIQVNTSVHSKLTVRAALSDGGLFKVGYALDSADAPCVYPAALRWVLADANGGYRVKSVVLPAGETVYKICIYLTDNANAIDFGRSSVLIDYIQLRSAAGAIGWQEGFAESP
jgi:hypothetical protein